MQTESRVGMRMLRQYCLRHTESRGPPSASGTAVAKLIGDSSGKFLISGMRAI